MFRARAGFTLVELMLAIAIALIVLMMALPSLSGISTERKLRESFERFDAFARRAQIKAVSEQRPWVIVWRPEAILLQPDAPKPEELQAGGAAGEESIPVSEEEKWTVTREASLLPAQQTGQEWVFWRSGTCEPVTITYEGPDGWWVAHFNPLTGRGEIVQQDTR